MSIREITISVIKRQIEGFVPYEFDLCPSLTEDFKKRTGSYDYRSYYGIPFRHIEVKHTGKGIDPLEYFDEIKPNTSFNDWGVGFEPSDTEHFTHMIHPMEKFDNIDQFVNYPYPSPNMDYEWRKLKEDVANAKKHDRVPVGWLALTIFEIAWYLRGIEEFLIDMHSDSEFCNYLLDRITNIRCTQALNYVKSGVDILHLGDDIATQLDLMMSPELWRKHLKKRLKKVIDTAKNENPNIIIDYHSDGNVIKVIPDLIDIGIDVLNPVQPECMDPVAIKKEYGNRLSFRGTIGTQSIMPFGTSEEVEKYCTKMIEIVGIGGGLVLSPSHMIEPEVPWRNIEAMLGVIGKHNKNFLDKRIINGV